jgi:hypothetical protein
LTSTRISVSRDYVGLLDDADEYRIRLDKAIRISVKLSELTADADIELLSSSGHVLNASTRAGIKYELIARKLNAGTYYVRVFPKTTGSTSYALRIAGSA